MKEFVDFKLIPSQCLNVAWILVASVINYVYNYMNVCVWGGQNIIHGLKVAHIDFGWSVS